MMFLIMEFIYVGINDEFWSNIYFYLVVYY